MNWLKRAPIRGLLVDALLASSLALAYLTALLGSTATLGYARDEGFYFQAASSYARWFELLAQNRALALSPRTIDAHWGVNHEHPGFVKSLFALSNLVLEKRFHLFAMEGTSYRFPAMVLGGLSIALVYLWGREARGRVAGLAAAACLAAMPRFFYQSHLACFDIPIAFVWTFTAYSYWRSRRAPGVLWPLVTAVAFGVALDTKHNSWFLPILVAGHLLAREVLSALSLGRDGLSPEAAAAARTRALGTLAAMALVGPLVFYALWPWIWHDTLPRLRGYASFHLNHEYYNMEFLGRNYWTPPMPRAYAWVMTAATVPTVTLALFAVGLCARGRARGGPLLAAFAAALSAKAGARLPRLAALARRAARLPRPTPDSAGTDLLWLLALLVNYAAWLSPTTPIFGGTKHWMTAYPFLALFAGAGFDAVVRAARRELLRARSMLGRRVGKRAALVAGLLGVAVFTAPFLETAHAHPWGLSSYTPLVGGAPGAATLGLNRTFWGYTTGAMAEYLNREVPRRGTVYLHDTAGAAWEMLAADGRLRRDIRGASTIAGADVGLYHHEKHMLGQEYQNWVAFGTVQPAAIGGLDGVPVILVYKQPVRRAGQNARPDVGR